MKLTTYRLLMAVFALGLGAELLAEGKQEYAQVSLCAPSSSKTPPPPNQFVILVIDGPNLTYDANPIPSTDVVDYVNKLLETKDASSIGVYAREGTTYGDVVRAIDLLRETRTKNIGISTRALPYGREP